MIEEEYINFFKDIFTNGLVSGFIVGFSCVVINSLIRTLKNIFMKG